MYEKIEQGKHIKKINKIEIDPNSTGTVSAGKKSDKKKKEKPLTVQQLNV